jgi:hypothetical protein
MHKTLTMEQAKVEKRNIEEGQTLLLSFFSGKTRESSHNGATDQQNR